MNNPIKNILKSQQSLRLLIISVILLGGAFVYFKSLYDIFASGFGCDFDDAYMFSRYAHNLLNGNGFTWNAGTSPVYGPTSIPYVFIVAFFMWFVPLGINFLLSSISWIIGLVVLALLASTALALTKTSSLPITAIAVGCVAWVAITPFFTYHATTGMDTTLSMLANTLLVLAWMKLSDKRGIKRVGILVLCAYLSFSIRPDNIIYAFAFPVLALLVIESPSRWREALLFLALLASLIAADALLKISVFGDPFPLSYYVKQHSFYQGYRSESDWNPITYLSIFIIGILPSCLVLLSGFRRTHTKLAIVYLTPVLVTFAYYFRVLQIMGQYARYYYPALPFVVILSILVLRDLKSLPTGAEFRKAALRLILSTLSLMGLLLFLATAGQSLYSTLMFGKQTLPEKATAMNPPGANIQKIGWGKSILGMASIVQQLPEGTIFAASEIGYIGAYAPQVEIIDMVGLNDPVIAHHGFNVADLIARGPDLIWMPHTDYTFIRSELECDPDFYANYTYYPSLFDYGIAARKNGDHTNGIKILLSKSLESVYPKLKVPLEALAEDGPPASCNTGNIPAPNPNPSSHPTP